jgi:hypothetical protein
VGRADSDVDSTKMGDYQLLRKLTIEKEGLVKQSHRRKYVLEVPGRFSEAVLNHASSSLTLPAVNAKS